MNRRSFLNTLNPVPPGGGPESGNKYSNRRIPSFKSFVPGLDQYTGPWTSLEARHLLNRCLFGHTRQQAESFASMSTQAAVSAILTPYPVQAPPLNNYFAQVPDPDCPAGETWTNKGYSELTNTQRLLSFKDWWLSLMIAQPASIHEKMVLFWHNLFATQGYTVRNAQYVYKHNQLLRTHALGNYRNLVKLVTLDPAMLIYLNGNKNQKNNPDENYARELQELFTLGKGPGSQYTEDDVKAAARVLTGYQIDHTAEAYFFTPNKHDATNKQFSSFYNNTIIAGQAGAAGESELDDLLDMIFSKDEVSLNIMRELYRWFVYYVIDDEIEEKVIQPLAQLFRDSNYEILPVLEKLLNSEHFFDAYNRGCLIKNPLDFTLSNIKNFEITLPASTLPEQYRAWRSLNTYHALMGMDPGDPPNVAGWEAYWNSPVYHEFWINSVTLPYRDGFSELLLTPQGFLLQGVSIKVDFVDFTTTIPAAADPNALISWLEARFFTHDLGASVRAALKAILLSNQAQDYYWTDAWNNYLSDPGNTVYYNIVYSRLYSFYKYMLHLAEYQLI